MICAVCQQEFNHDQYNIFCNQCGEELEQEMSYDRGPKGLDHKEIYASVQIGIKQDGSPLYAGELLEENDNLRNELKLSQEGWELIHKELREENTRYREALEWCSGYSSCRSCSTALNPKEHTHD